MATVSGSLRHDGENGFVGSGRLAPKPIATAADAPLHHPLGSTNQWAEVIDVGSHYRPCVRSWCRFDRCRPQSTRQCRRWQAASNALGADPGRSRRDRRSQGVIAKARRYINHQSRAVRSSTYSRAGTRACPLLEQWRRIPTRRSCNSSGVRRTCRRCERRWSSPPHPSMREGSVPLGRSSTVWTGGQRRLWLPLRKESKELV